MNKKMIVRRVITSESYMQQRMSRQRDVRMDSEEEGNHNKEKKRDNNITLYLKVRKNYNFQIIFIHIFLSSNLNYLINYLIIIALYFSFNNFISSKLITSN